MQEHERAHPPLPLSHAARSSSSLGGQLGRPLPWGAVGRAGRDNKEEEKEEPQREPGSAGEEMDCWLVWMDGGTHARLTD